MTATFGDRVTHIKEAIGNIRLLRSRAADEKIKNDPVLRAALERFFEIISEASRYVPEERRLAYPHIPWKQIAGIGNFLRHAYDGIDIDVLINAAGADLDLLECAIDDMTAGEGPQT
ncbi:DUF86 domain-containing protein [Bosea caraganae]|uniref:DUF86 domain-containing protein n=1 Tax=Bosea caraganae TaxID=2763117 RepID=A0A370L3Q8_9HYPH|nr:HepT-like ribonuclease domain-containing protein [Bosea caraganae]RDJ23013.1 DUF86 domain-containing protein [Bosea caraganae]RDJ28793.1 DUF86 domain-containing protein [Bosea caraganae]